MKRFKKLFLKPGVLALSLFFIWSSYSLADQVWEDEGADLVARISVIEGRLERFDPETNAWVVTIPDAPVGIDDQLFAGAGARVEIIIPNNTILRIGEEAEVRFVSLTEKLTEIDVSSGTARLYNNSSQADFIAATPLGRIEVPPGASVDLYVEDKAVRIISLDNSVYFTGGASAARHEIIAGSACLLAYPDRIMASGGSADPGWDAWNRDHDNLRAERRRSSSESLDYLPIPLSNEAYALDAYGSWQPVYYEGAYYRFWRPRYVGSVWTPFTVGMWMNWRGDRVWISREPFGYVTHHYGGWIYAQDAWYWAPPVSLTMARTGLPLLRIGYRWYPGRVAWIDAGVHARWIPLAPFEPYYCRYPWGIRSIAMTNGSSPRYASSHKFKYQRHTVMARQDNFYRNREGSHVSKRTTVSRSGVYSSPAPRNVERSETRGFRDTREKKSGNQIREDEKSEVTRTRDRQKRPESKSRNRSGLTRTDKSAVRTDPPGRVEGKITNRYGSEMKEDNRKSTTERNNSAVSKPPVENRQFNNPAAEQRNNQLKKQTRLQTTTDNLQRSESQNRSGLTRTDKNAFRMGNSTQRIR